VLGVAPHQTTFLSFVLPPGFIIIFLSSKNNYKIKKSFNFKKATLRLPLVDYAVRLQTTELSLRGLMSMAVPEPVYSVLGAFVLTV
jgi:hypothetical protein